ncbi:elongation factor 4 [bacterium]|nr:elongation factor 4 [bacterium]
MDRRLIRNFCIIAHVDHGKSTLADRILEYAGAVSDRDKRDQMLDTMELERERGITIKAQAACFNYTAADGAVYRLNLVDTPGHVDFSYEVSRALTACEGALLVVDAAQGVEAQTIANLHKALDADLEILPVLNKIDLPGADVDSTIEQLHDLFGCDPDECLLASAKTGEGTAEILSAIIARVPPPAGDPDAPLSALVIDSIYDTYRGVVAYFRIFDGTVKEGDIIRLMARGMDYEVSEVGVFTPAMKRVGELSAGDVGYLMANIRQVKDLSIGDTITHKSRPAAAPLPGYKPAKSMVFCGMYPTESHEYELLRDCLERLNLNDSAFHFEPETSAALGFGYRCGFLGMLHMDIVQERLEREYNLSLVITAPNVVYRVKTKKGELLEFDNPSKLPPANLIDEIAEPYIHATIITPNEYVGPVMKLAMDRRGIDRGSEFLPGGRVIMKYDFPLAEVILDFHDKIKTISRGYASFDYEFADFRPGKIVKLDILVNGDPVDALSVMVHREKAQEKGRQLVEKIRKVIPRQQYDVAIQAALGGQIIARETVKALRKNVTAKCYGGDITRKRKLLERQKEGKKRMKQIGSVVIPQEAFMAILDI